MQAVGPYSLSWLDSSYRETLLPGSPWSKIRDAINSRLADRMKKCSLDEESKQAVLELLGKQFVEKYLTLPDSGAGEVDSSTSAQENMSASHSKAREWLQQGLQEITRDLRCDFSLQAERGGGNMMSTDMLEYTSFVRQVVHRGMERELAVRERAQKMERPPYKSPKTKPELLACSCQSEVLGKSIASILSREPVRLNNLCEKLYGLPLPPPLRQIVWRLKLLKAERLPTCSHVQTELTETQEHFNDSLAWGQKELNVSSALHSPIEGVIRVVVLEEYQHRVGLQHELVTQLHTKLATEALNVLYVHSRAYEPFYAMLVFPLISAFALDERTDHDLDEAPCRIALFFSLLMKNCFPSRLEIFSIADRVIRRLKDEDEELYHHLMNATRKNVSFDSREFLVNFIHKEKEKAQLIEGELTSGGLQTLAADARELLSHPIIFIRKWLAEGFVGALGVDAVMLVWDQLFMSGWKPSVLMNVCLVIIELLREELVKTTDYDSVKRVLLDKACKLYTLDVQRGIVYMTNGGALRDVNAIKHVVTPPRSFTDESPQPSPAVTNLSSRPQTRRSRSTVPPSHRETAVPEPEPAMAENQWVARSWTSPLPTPSKLDEPFDLYVDEVRCIPDNATIIKVTGRVLGPFWEKPEVLDTQDVEAFPLLDSPARSPQFKYKYVVNAPGRRGLPAEAVLLLRVYTIDVDTGELVVIGNAALQLFVEDGEEAFLNVGGHQLRLRHVLPSTVAKLTVAAFEEIFHVPVTTLLVRLLPHSEEFVESPGYPSGYYFSEECQPNEAEQRIFSHYVNFEPYPPTVREATQDIKDEEDEEGQGAVNDTTSVMSTTVAEQWYKTRMSKHQLRMHAPNPTDPTTLVHYDQKQGLCVSVEQAHGLPSAQFVNALVHVSPGPQARQEGSPPEGDTEKALTEHRDFDSPQSSPRWLDPPIVFHPHRDPVSSLVITLYSLDAVYTPTADRVGPGAVSGRKGGEPILSPQGWSVLPLFNKNCVNAGIYHLPLLRGSPSSTFMEFLSQNPAEHSFREAIRQKVHELQGTSSVVVRLWDAHYSKEQCIPLPRKDLLSVGKPDKYKKTAQNVSGKPISDVVLQCLTKQERKEGVAGQACGTEKLHYEDAMNAVFKDKMEDVFLRLGFGPGD